jgi:hypothetical protein
MDTDGGNHLYTFFVYDFESLRKQKNHKKRNLLPAE